jgi:PAS domain S-box-containing protein
MYTVLYVDDDADLLMLGRRFLERSPEFSVIPFASASEALDFTGISGCDAIVSDYQMPGMDGIGFLKAVRERHGDIPFILFTGRGREEIVIQAINNGADFYLQKGGDVKAQFAELQHKIRQAVARRQAEHSLVESEKRLTDIINFLPDATFAIDREGKIIAWNRAIEEMTGVSASDMIGKGNYEHSIPFYGNRRPSLIEMVFEPEDALAQRYTHVCRDHGIITAETVVSHPDGRSRILMATARPLYDRQGDVAGAIESLRDISGMRNAEEALKASEEKYRLVVEHSQDAVYIHRQDRVLFANTRASELTGYTHDELMKIRLWDLVHPDDRAALVERAKRRFAREEVPPDFTARLLTKDGHEKPCEFFVDLVTYQGAPAIIGIARDITARKETEDSLRASEARFRELAETLPQIILEMDKDLRITYMNLHARRLTGLTREDLSRPYTAFDFIAPEDHERARENIGRIIRGEVADEHDYGVVLADGTRLFVTLYASPVLQDGTFAGLRAIIVDITARKLAEQALHESEDKYRRILENLQDAYFHVDRNGNLVMVSPSVTRIFGYDSPEEVIGRPALSLYYDPNQRARILKLLERDGKVSDYTGDARRKDGSSFWASLSVQYLKDPEGNIIGTEGIVRDISGRKTMEHAIKEANQKLNLLNTITRHDVTNQLTALQGYVQLAGMKKPDPAVMALLHKIEQAADTIERQIEFTRLYQELGIHAPSWFALDTVVARASGTPVPVHFSGSCRTVLILADPLLERVFFNLFENAVRHGKSATAITVRCEQGPDDLLVIVEDDGVGVKSHEKEKIFTKGYGKNTGLGLFLTKEILAITGITIRETGTFGNGARFEMRVPQGAWRLPEENVPSPRSP